MNPSAIPSVPPVLSRNSRALVLFVAFLGWLCAGVHMSITQLIGQAAAIDLLAQTDSLDAARYQALTQMAQANPASLAAEEQAQLQAWKEMVGRWFAWYQCAFLFGAAAGGLVFGWLGDRFGRAKGMSASIFTYSALAGAA